MRTIVAMAVACLASCVTAAVSLHPASAMARIGGVDGRIPSSENKYRLQLVRGEREGCQFAVLPKGKEPVAVKNVAVRAESPQAPATMLYRVLAVNHTAPPTEGMFVIPPRNLGWVSDVLMPLAGRAPEAQAVAAKEGEAPLTYYVEIVCPRDTQPGKCKYVVEVSGENWSAELKLEAEVSPVALPVRLPFRTAICWNWSLEQYYGRPLELAEKQAFWHFCLDQRLSPCAFFSPAPDPAPAEAAKLVERGLSVVCLMQAGGRKPRLFSDKRKKELEPLLRQWREELLKCKLQDDAVVLISDEPEASAAEICRQNAQWLKGQYPELKIWCATRPGAPWDEFVDVFGTVMAHSTKLYEPHSHTDDAAFAFRQKKPFPKGEYWWFHSVEPYAPHTNLRLDNRLIEARVTGWQSAHYGVDGYEYFWIADWSGNVETKALPWPERAGKWKTGLSGAGTLCYPDEKLRPMPSLRLVNLRDGFEDWALLEMLSPRGGEWQDRLRNKNSLTDYWNKPEELLDARRELVRKLMARHQ